MRIIFVASTVALFLFSLEIVEAKMNFQQLQNAAKGPRNSCQKSTGCPEELIEAGKNGQFSPVPELQCFFKCMFIKMKVIKNDKISWPAMNQQMNLMLNPDLAERYANIVEACQSQVTSQDMCEAAYQFAMCSWNVDNSLYFFG